MRKTKNNQQLLGLPPATGKFQVYALYCPVAKQVRYIGMTGNSLAQRLAGHIGEAARKPDSPKGQWILALAQRGLRPYIRSIKLLDDIQEASAWEQCAIICFRGRRALCNRDCKASSALSNDTTYPLVAQWFTTPAGFPRETEWASLQPDIRQERIDRIQRKELRLAINSLAFVAATMAVVADNERQRPCLHPSRAKRLAPGYLQTMEVEIKKYVKILAALSMG